MPLLLALALEADEPLSACCDPDCEALSGWSDPDAGWSDPGGIVPNALVCGSVFMSWRELPPFGAALATFGTANAPAHITRIKRGRQARRMGKPRMPEE